MGRLADHPCVPPGAGNPLTPIASAKATQEKGKTMPKPTPADIQEELDFMTRIIGMTEPEAKRRIATAYRVTVSTINRYLRNSRGLVAA